ncbi:MAG: T9SS type A sorting domain-containing protein [Bacteroidia bacterium]|nr:T9SS type A sorting domain-containing protein [Bacteroidia bacterium]
MKNFTTLFIAICLACLPNIHAQFVQLETGIEADLHGIVFYNDYGLVTTDSGLYYTLTGGNGDSTWFRFTLQGNTVDSLIYERTKFDKCYADEFFNGSGNHHIFALGQDTLTNRSVLFRLSLPSLRSRIVYQSPPNTKLNDIGYNSLFDRYLAVGDNALVIRFDTLFASFPSVPIIADYKTIHFLRGGFSCIVTTDTSANFASDFNGFSINSSNRLDTAVIHDVYYNSPRPVLAGNNFYRTLQNPFLRVVKNVDFGPLNASQIASYDARFFFATDHGVFSTVSNMDTVIEWNPSSGTHNYNGIWAPRGNNQGVYACGDSGLVIYNNGNFIDVKPYVDLFIKDACVGANLEIKTTRGSSNACRWFVDGNFESFNCNFVRSFNSPGTYTITLVGSFGFESDTAEVLVHVLPLPNVNPSFSVLDTILCKEESIVVSFDSSETNVTYSFIAPGFPLFGTSNPGNDSLLVFTSNPISEDANINIFATNIVGGCFVELIDTIKVVVEKTEANFYIDRVNAQVSETVNFYNQSVDAQNYAWTFPSDATLLSSNLEDVSNSFSVAGSKSVELIASSNAGCRDTLQSNTLGIVAPLPSVDTCWLNQNQDDDLPWPGLFFESISSMIPGKTAYYICGSYNDITFATQAGDSLTQDGHGGYVAKYDYNGILKWWVHTETRRIGNIGRSRDIVNYVVEDDSGNVYLSGKSHGTFFDNRGDSLDFELEPPLISFPPTYLIKLDSTGKLLWNLTNTADRVEAMSLDKDMNILLGLATNPFSEVLYFNGQPRDTVLQNCSSCNYQVLKINPTGELVWDFNFELERINPVQITDLGTDSLNNVFIYGDFERGATFYSVGAAVGNQLLGAPIGSFGPRLFLAKIDSAGQYLWSIKSNSLGSGSNVWTHDMEVDSKGNAYLSGRNEVKSPSMLQRFYNTDSSINSFSVGGMFLAKVNPDGICQWVQGTQWSNFGTGHAVYLQGDEVSVFGDAFQTNFPYSGQPELCRMTSENGQGVLFTLERKDYFVADYDTNGNLLRLQKNDDNPSRNGNHYEGRSLFRTSEGDYYLSFNSSTEGPLKTFGGQIDTSWAIDGFVDRFREGCGITYDPCPLLLTRDTTSVCPQGSISFPDGTTYDFISAPFTHRYETISSLTCDSVIETYVDISPEYDLQDSVDICSGSDFTFPDGSTQFFIQADLNYTSMLSSSLGCDSSITTKLRVIGINDSVNLGSASAEIAETGADSIQWFNCSSGNFLVVPNETERILTPDSMGSYAAVIYKNGCNDTTECVLIELGRVQNPLLDKVRIYPNPNEGLLFVEFEEVMPSVAIRITDLRGKEVFRGDFVGKSLYAINVQAPAGLYLITIELPDGSSTRQKLYVN